MNSFKFILAQAKAMKSTWLTACGSGTGSVRFQGTTKLPAEGKELNAIVANAVKAVLTANTRKKAKASIDSGS